MHIRPPLCTSAFDVFYVLVVSSEQCSFPRPKDRALDLGFPEREQLDKCGRVSNIDAEDLRLLKLNAKCRDGLTPAVAMITELHQVVGYLTVSTIHNAAYRNTPALLRGQVHHISGGNSRLRRMCNFSAALHSTAGGRNVEKILQRGTPTLLRSGALLAKKVRLAVSLRRLVPKPRIPRSG